MTKSSSTLGRLGSLRRASSKSSEAVADTTTLETPDDFLPNFDGQPDDDPKAALSGLSPRVLIAREHVVVALPRRVRLALKSHKPIVIVIETPTAAWTTQIEIAVGDLFRPRRVIGVSAQPGRSSNPETPTVEGSVVAITNNIGWISPALYAGADLRVAIRGDAQVVEKVIGIVCGRRAKVTPTDIAGLDITDLAFAIRSGTSAQSCVARLRKAASAKSVVSPNDRTPTLDQLVGYGKALDQVRAVAADVARVQAGELAASELPSLLFYGPPGCGKTMLAKSLAKSVGLPIIATSVSEWFSSSDGYLGGVTKAANDFFNAAAAMAPCIAFMDEIDAIPDRAAIGARGRDWWGPVVTGILLMIDTVRLRGSGVILVGATNHRDHLDDALRRPGRLDRHIEILGPTTAEELAEVLRHHLHDDLSDVDLTAMARLGRGGTGAIAEGWVRQARETARNADRPMSEADLTDAIAPREVRSSAEVRRIAFHESGHAIVGRVLGLTVTAVSIVEDDASGGRTSIEEMNGILSRLQLERRVMTMLAGRAADEAFSGGATSGAALDLARATELVASIHGVLGLGESLISHGLDENAARILVLDQTLRTTVEAELQRLMAETRVLVQDHAGPIRALAEILIAKRVATTHDINRTLATPRIALAEAEKTNETLPSGSP